MATSKKSPKKVAPTKAAANDLIINDLSTLEVRLDDNTTVMAAFKFGKGSDVGIISLSEYGGKRALDLRRFYADDDGVLNPTAKGVRIPIEAVPAIVGLLTSDESMAAIHQFAEGGAA